MSLSIGIGLGLIPTAARPAATTAPVNVVKPFFEGPLTQGQSAAVNPGAWTGLPSPNFAYAIKRGATTVSTDPDYVWTSADVAAGAGAMTVAVTATNDIGPTTETSDPATIAAPLQISGTPAAAPVGLPYAFAPTVAGGHAPFAFSLTGTLPAGLTFSTSTGAISGTPVASGTASLSIRVTDGDTLTSVLGPFDLVVGATTSAITLFEVMSATPLDATGAYGDATARTGVDGNGWVVKAVMPYLVAQTFDPSKITVEIQDPGYDASGPTTQTRTIKGTEVLRRQYNAAASKQESNNGVSLTVYFALDDLIYAGSTVSAVTAAPGFYGSSAAGGVSSPANNSTRTYPKPLVGFLNVQEDRATGAGFAVEAVATHRHARNGRQVARIEFIAKDAQGSPNVAATQVAAATSLSAFQTQGNPAECYKATIPLAALTQGDTCQVNVKVYPWIGDSSAVLDLDVDGVAWPTANPQTKLRFLNDKGGTYGGAYAYVKAGAVGGVVSRTAATARANPYPKIEAALPALATFNNANSVPTHNDHSGSIIRLMDDGAGGAVAHVISTEDYTAAGKCLTDIEADPLAVGAATLSMTTTKHMADKLRWKVRIDHTAGNGFDSFNANGNQMVVFEGITINGAGATPLGYRNGLIYQRNVTHLTSGLNAMLAGYSTTRTQCALALGVIAEAAAGDGAVKPFLMVGCKLRRFALQEIDQTAVPNNDSGDGVIVLNTTFRDIRSTGTISTLGQRPYVKGMGLVQNLFEVSGGGQTALRFGGDGTFAPFDNIVRMHNTFVGGRINTAYADVAAAAGVTRRVTDKFNLNNVTWNCKSDTFTGSPPGTVTATGRVGNWEYRYNVGNKGNVVTGGSAGGAAPDPAGTSWLGEWWPAATYNVGAANVTFTDDKSTPIGSGALGGTYSLTGLTNAAYAQVPAGEAVLSFDIAGNPRLNNGAGASGAYERA